MIFVLIRTLIVLHLVQLDDKTDLLEHIMHPVSVTCVFFSERGRLPCPQPPNLEDQGITLCPVSTFPPVRHGWSYQECKTPADIALGVIETRKLPHHDRVVTPLEAAED